MFMQAAEEIEKLRYPAGRFEFGKHYTFENTKRSIDRLKDFPQSLEDFFRNFKKENLNKTYRDGGWTALQLFNHLVDVYINAYMRTKWLLAEQDAILKPYNENECAKLADSKYKNVEDSIMLIKFLFDRWLFLLESLPQEIFNKTIYHPEYKVTISLHELVAMYEWHGYHHLAHLKIINGN